MTRSTLWRVADITLQAESPFLIASGDTDGSTDALPVVDANGLPTIPGSSLAGVLRAAYLGVYGELQTKRLFGFQDEGATSYDQAGQASLLEVSWGQVHGADNLPVPLRDFDAHAADPVLAFLRQGVRREHVRLNPQGVPDDQGKFDETLVPRGARFTAELLLRDSGAGENRLTQLLTLLATPGFRLGGRTRMGFGAFRVVSVRTRDFDLCTPGGRAAWGSMPRALSAPERRAVLPEVAVAAGTRRFAQSHTLVVKPKDHWIFGGEAEWTAGEEAPATHRANGKKRDMVPVFEQSVIWNADRGTVSPPEWVVPATGIKGALRHRTAFHVRRLQGHWAEEAPPKGEPLAVQSLFGSEGEHGDRGFHLHDDDGTMRPGRVFISEARLARNSSKDGSLDHVAIDRFTGGALDGALFGEAPRFGGEWRLEIDIASPFGKPSSEDALGVKALGLALEDLSKGRLPVGGGANRGHGFVTAEGLRDV